MHVRTEVGCRADRVCTGNDRLRFWHGGAARLVCASDVRRPYDPAQLAGHIAENPYEAESLIWTLNLDATPVYAIIPAGPYAAVAYERLRQAFQGQLQDGVEIVSVPGLMVGNVRLLSGQVVPGLVPSVRGMFS
jgi:PatG Domain